LYVRDVVGQVEVAAWRPSVAGITEVFHARYTAHAYPMHTHQAWTLLIVDDGVVGYALDRHDHTAARSVVTLLPPYVPHDGYAATSTGFRKRVLYLQAELLAESLIGAAVDRPFVTDPLLRRRIHQLHQVLLRPGEQLEADSRLALIHGRLHQHLAGRVDHQPHRPDAELANRLRELLDSRVPAGITLAEAARQLGAHPARLLRAFTRQHGIPPHQYLTGRRVELARLLLLSGRPPALAAADAGFYDQSHLTRHFKRMLGTSPARYAVASGPRAHPAITVTDIGPPVYG
jgi:AraC-like DNA-binding protein